VNSDFIPHRAWDLVKLKSKEILKALQSQAQRTSNFVLHPYREIFVQWDSPPGDWIKLNLDGASRGNPGPTGAGGVFRGPHGNWVFGFSINLGRCTVVKAKLLTLK